MELLTSSPCQEGNPPVPGNRPAKVTLIIYWKSAKKGARARASVLCVRACAVRECVRACVSACVCLLEEALSGGGGALRTSALLTGNNLR